MFFSNLSELPKIVARTNFSIVCAEPESALATLLNAFSVSGSPCSILAPDEKTNKISVDAVRDFISATALSEKSRRFFVIKNAETLNPASENAILKTLEEPKSNHIFIFLTSAPSLLLPTILSRAQLYIFKSSPDSLTAPPKVNEQLKADAKTLISLTSALSTPKTATKATKDLIAFATTLSKKKDNARLYSQQLVATSIEMLYKTYLLTEKTQYLQVLPRLIKLHENLSRNGHIKLQIVANML